MLPVNICQFIRAATLVLLLCATAASCTRDIRVFVTKRTVSGAFGDVEGALSVCREEGGESSSQWRPLLAKQLPHFDSTTNSEALSKIQSRFPASLPGQFRFVNTNGEALTSNVDDLFDSVSGGTLAPLRFPDGAEVPEGATVWTGADMSGKPTSVECSRVVYNEEEANAAALTASDGECGDPAVDEELRQLHREQTAQRFPWMSSDASAMGTASRLRTASQSAKNKYVASEDASGSSDAKAEGSPSNSWLDSFSSSCDKQHHLLCIEIPSFPKNADNLIIASGPSMEDVHPNVLKLLKNPPPEKNCLVQATGQDGRFTENHMCCVHRGLILRINEVLVCQSKGTQVGKPLRLPCFAAESPEPGKPCFSGCYSV